MLVGLAGLAWSLWKRPPAYMFLSFGFGYLAYTGLSLGIASLKSWESWFWQERFFLFPYEFAGVLLAIALLGAVPRRWGRGMIPIGSAVVVVILFAAQAEWAPILPSSPCSCSGWDRSSDSSPLSGIGAGARRIRVLSAS